MFFVSSKDFNMGAPQSGILDKTLGVRASQTSLDPDLKKANDSGGYTTMSFYRNHELNLAGPLQDQLFLKIMICLFSDIQTGVSPPKLVASASLISVKYRGVSKMSCNFIMQSFLLSLVISRKLLEYFKPSTAF